MKHIICIVAGMALFYPAYRLHTEAHAMSSKATDPPIGANVSEHPEDFFGEDPRVFAEKPENLALRNAAIELDRQALCVAAVAVILILAGLWPVLRVAVRPFTPVTGADKEGRDGEPASPRHSLGRLGGDSGHLPEPAAPGGSQGCDGGNLPGGAGRAGGV